METYGDPTEWLAFATSDHIAAKVFEYALSFHVSLINFRNRPITDTALRLRVDDFLDRLGYQIHVLGANATIVEQRKHTQNMTHMHSLSYLIVNITQEN